MSHTNYLQIDTPFATLPGAWRYRTSAWTGWPRISILRLGEAETATSVSVWQHIDLSKQIRPLNALACCWGVKQQTNQPPPPTTTAHNWVIVQNDDNLQCPSGKEVDGCTQMCLPLSLEASFL